MQDLSILKTLIGHILANVIYNHILDHFVCEIIKSRVVI